MKIFMMITVFLNTFISYVLLCAERHESLCMLQEAIASSSSPCADRGLCAERHESLCMCKRIPPSAGRLAPAGALCGKARIPLHVARRYRFQQFALRRQGALCGKARIPLHVARRYRFQHGPLPPAAGSVQTLCEFKEKTIIQNLLAQRTTRVWEAKEHSD